MYNFRVNPKPVKQQCMAILEPTKKPTLFQAPIEKFQRKIIRLFQELIFLTDFTGVSV